MSGIHHFVPVLHRGDAVGRHTLRLRDATRARGIHSEIYVDTVDPETAEETVPVLSYAAAARQGDVVVYQFATASAMAPWLAGRSETLVVNYHNITPPELMAPWDNHLALGQLRVQGDLRLLAPRTTVAVADSAYNQAHLAAAGFATTAVIPPSAALDPALNVEAAGAAPRGGRGAPVACRGTGVAQQGAREHDCRVWPSPGLTATRRRRCRSSGSRPRTPTWPRCTATWPRWGWPMRSPSQGMPVTPRWRRPMPAPRCSS